MYTKSEYEHRHGIRRAQSTEHTQHTSHTHIHIISINRIVMDLTLSKFHSFGFFGCCFEYAVFLPVLFACLLVRWNIHLVQPLRSLYLSRSFAPFASLARSLCLSVARSLSRSRPNYGHSLKSEPLARGILSTIIK